MQHVHVNIFRWEFLVPIGDLHHPLSAHAQPALKESHEVLASAITYCTANLPIPDSVSSAGKPHVWEWILQVLAETFGDRDSMHGPFTLLLHDDPIKLLCLRKGELHRD
jgi:hypothetical protein